MRCPCVMYLAKRSKLSQNKSLSVCPLTGMLYIIVFVFLHVPRKLCDQLNSNRLHPDNLAFVAVTKLVENTQHRTRYYRIINLKKRHLSVNV